MAEDNRGDPLGASEAADLPGPETDVGGEATPRLRGTGVSAALVIGVLLAILAIIIAVQNTESVSVHFLAWDVDAPLVAVILAAGVAGVVLDETLGFFWRRRRRSQLADRAALRRLRSD